MNLAQALQQLADGPIGDLSIGGGGTGTIPEAKVAGIVAKFQTALTDLHTRFALARKTINLVVIDGKFEYPLRAEFAQTSGSLEVNKFIKDTLAKPFTGDVLAIQHVYDADMCELPLNSRNDCRSWHTVAYDTLSMDYPVSGDSYFVEYQANHAELDPAANPATVELRVPRTLHEALLTRVAYLVFAGINTDSSNLKANELLGRYELLCESMSRNNVSNESQVESHHDRIRNGGWA